MGRVVNVLNGMDDVPGATITRYCASSVQTTRMAFHAIKAGEGDVFVSAGVETVSRFRKGTSDHSPTPRTRSSPRPRPAPRSRPRAARTGTTRARTASLPDVYIAMGQTAENVAQLRGLDRKELDEFGVAVAEPRREGDRRRLLGARDHPGHHARTAPWSARTTAPAPA